jgi:hypothetical protein
MNSRQAWNPWLAAGIAVLAGGWTSAQSTHDAAAGSGETPGRYQNPVVLFDPPPMTTHAGTGVQGSFPGAYQNPVVPFDPPPASSHGAAGAQGAFPGPYQNPVVPFDPPPATSHGAAGALGSSAGAYRNPWVPFDPGYGTPVKLQDGTLGQQPGKLPGGSTGIAFAPPDIGDPMFAPAPVDVVLDHFPMTKSASGGLRISQAQAHVRPLSQMRPAPGAPAYANDDLAGSYAVPGVSERWVDWGRIDGELRVSAFTFAYATTAIDRALGGPGAALAVALYDGTKGGGVLGSEVVRLDLEGLPASLDGSVVSFRVRVALAAELEVRLSGGAAGWAYTGIDGHTGPLLVRTSGLCGEQGDASTGTTDCFDIYFPDSVQHENYVGRFALAARGIASFYMALEEVRRPDQAFSAIYEGTGVNPSIFIEGSPARLDSAWVTALDLSEHPATLFTIVAVSSGPGRDHLSPAGEVLVDLTPSGLMLVDVSQGLHSIQIPGDSDLIGRNLFAQGALFDGALVLANAIDVTIGR